LRVIDLFSSSDSAPAPPDALAPHGMTPETAANVAIADSRILYGFMIGSQRRSAWGG
jgi:hypothetical protein